MDILLFHAGDFIEKLPWVNDHAITNNRELTAANNAGWQKVQLEDLAIDDECVAGIMAALKSYDYVSAVAEPVNDFTFTFVTPLGTDNNDSGHEYLSARTAGKGQCLASKSKGWIRLYADFC